MRVVVTGAAGMLAADVIRALGRAGHDPVGLGRRELDITVGAEIGKRLADTGAEAVVNCAAYTDVDGAEVRPEDAAAVNAKGAGDLAAAAAARGIPMVHVSSDYVFDGKPNLDPTGRRVPYVESDPTAPLSVYGRTKLEGEALVLAASSGHAVVRSSWLFGLGGGNFVETMLRLAGERDEVAVVDDQVGSPTWTGHLAPGLVGLLEREVAGLVHLAGGGEVSWNGFAKEIFRQAERGCGVSAITTEQAGRPAPRPAYSAMASEREDVLPMPDWRDGLAGYLAARDGMIRT